MVQALPSSQALPEVVTMTPSTHSAQNNPISSTAFSSIFPSQLLSIPSQSSKALGLIDALLSSQSP